MLTEVLRRGARRLLAAALDAEVETFLAAFGDVRDEDRRRTMVRNGYLSERQVQTGIGAVPVKQPRVRSRPAADGTAEHWQHLRTTNPIESTFATVRLRTTKMKGCGSRIATLITVYKLAQSAQKNRRRMNGSKLPQNSPRNPIQGRHQGRRVIGQLKSPYTRLDRISFSSV